ncbi:hypothetical protein M2164_004026 [Streptomyces sp. SAI-208]|uniref:hypothetical protein n=1 Tax=Streptomyces sp. SAI-208 TaxID=2940550 RepID=UPI0024769FC0|nr:hypothetical protein [Streptomyces sp. SAI-208]MDH6608391.1 hypothetical protein [Streptomyces sp. SAI-208]
MDDLRRIPGRPVWAILAMLVLLPGCSTERKVEYTLPKTLCGVPVSQDALKPLFPPGKELTQTGGSLADGQDQSACSYLVDGNTALSLSDQRYQNKMTVQQVLIKSVPGSQRDEIIIAPGGHVATYRGHAVGLAECAGIPSDVDGEEAHSYAITASMGNPKDWQEAQTKLTRFMKKFLPAAAKTDGC